MQSLITADIISSLFIGILIIGILIKEDISKGTLLFLSVTFFILFGCITEALCGLLNHKGLNDILLYILWTSSYCFGSLSILMYIKYCAFYILERTKINKYFFIIPEILLLIGLINVLICSITGKIVSITNGNVIITGGMPFFSLSITLFCIIYLPILFFSIRKSIGLRNCCILSFMGIIPLTVNLLSLLFNYTDYSYPASALAIVIVYNLLESRKMHLMEQKKNQALLESKNQLEEKQRKLEESLTAQKDQLEEITALNNQMLKNQTILQQRYDVIQSMTSIYFASYYIDLVDDSYIELTSKESIRETIKAMGKAQSSLFIACEKLMKEEFTESMKQFLDLSTINQRLKDKVCVSQSYIGVTTGWSEAYLIAGDKDKDGNLLHIFYAAKTIHDEKALEEEQTRKLTEAKDEVYRAYGILEGLSREYHTIWSVNKDDLQMKLIRTSTVSTIKKAVQMGLNAVDYDDAVVKYVKDYVDPIDQERLYIELKSTNVLKMIKNQSTYTVDFLRRNENGTVGHHQISFVNADTETGVRQFVFAFRDIEKILNEEKSLKDELKEAKKIAEDANNAKTSFLFNMSHDIRTPMNAIIGFRDLLEKYQDDPKKRADYLEKIKDSSLILLSIINNVLEMARIERGSMTINNTVWNANQFNNNLTNYYTSLMKLKNISFTSTMSITNQYVYIDSTKLREVLDNLLTNAYKYTNHGGKVTMDLQELPCDKEGYALYRTTITDTGIGMSQDFVPHIFEEFSRESNTTENKIEGTGLGMPIVKRLIDLMEGTIEVKSTKGVGSTFIVTLPHRIANKEDLSTIESIEIDPKIFKDKRILLAEDNELNAEIALELLSDAGFIVYLAENGQVCLDKIKQQPAFYYDAVLMDVQMPIMNGYEATKAIRNLDDKEKAQIPIIAMTANAFEEDKTQAYKAGMNGHVAKPINIQALWQELSKVLG